MGKNVDTNISKNVTGKYSQKLLDHSRQSAANAPRTTSKIVVQKTADSTG